MIISDLNVLKAVEGSAVVGGTSRLDSFKFKKDIDIKVDTNLDFSFDSYVKDVFKKYADIDVKSNVKGNSSSFAFDNEAIGKNSNTQGSFNQLVVAGEGSSQNGLFVAAANY